jgi:hypothetical protein
VQQRESVTISRLQASTDTNYEHQHDVALVCESIELR